MMLALDFFFGCLVFFALCWLSLNVAKEWGLLFVVVCVLLVMGASLIAEHNL